MGARPVSLFVTPATRQAHAELLRALLAGAQNETLPMLIRCAMLRLCRVFNDRGPV